VETCTPILSRSVAANCRLEKDTIPSVSKSFIAAEYGLEGKRSQLGIHF
jgi:hypothetical protein